MKKIEDGDGKEGEGERKKRGSASLSGHGRRFGQRVRCISVGVDGVVFAVCEECSIRGGFRSIQPSFGTGLSKI